MAFDSSEEPLPLSSLHCWVSKEVYTWLQEAEDQDQKFREELERTYNANELFSNEKDDDDDNKKLVWKEETRVHKWSPSTSNPDGIMEDLIGSQKTDAQSECYDSEARSQCTQPTIVYLESDSSQGHGDMVWAAARHIANQLADPHSCFELLYPFFSCRDLTKETALNRDTHPLLGLRFLELGAGCGVPSWTALHCGAHVIATDIRACNRIRCMAESLERNWRELAVNKDNNKLSSEVLRNARRARICPYQWGDPVESVLAALNEPLENQKRFDVICAADCCYLTSLHSKLLQSIDGLLSRQKGAIALLPFALHGNAKDEEVWGITELAKTLGNVEVQKLETKQLAPPNSYMESKRGLVHTIRLVRK